MKSQQSRPAGTDQLEKRETKASADGQARDDRETPSDDELIEDLLANSQNRGEAPYLDHSFGFETRAFEA